MSQPANEYPASLSLSISDNEEDSPRSHSSSASTEYDYSDLLDEIIAPVVSNRPVRSNAVGASHPIFRKLAVSNPAPTVAASSSVTAVPPRAQAAAPPSPKARVPTLTEEWVEEQRLIAENQARIQREKAAEIQKQKDFFYFLTKEEKVAFQRKQQKEQEETWIRCLAVEDARAKALLPAVPGLPEGAVRSDMRPLNQEMRMHLGTGVKMSMALAALNKPVLRNFSFMQPAVFNLLQWDLPFANTQHPRLTVWCPKFDGNRALWDGFNGWFYSKSLNKSVRPSSDWLLWLPRNVFIDGELYLPAKDAVPGTATEFKSNMHHVAKVWSMGVQSIGSRLWKHLEFRAFDLVGDNDVIDTAWHNRNTLLWRLTQKGQAVTNISSDLKIFPNNDHFKRVEHYYLKEGSIEQVYTQLAQALSYVRARGGEGILLKEVSWRSKYKVGSTSNLWLKLKCYQDGEARVLYRFQSKEGLPGVMVQLSNGKECGIVHALHKLLYPSPERLPKDTIVSIQYQSVEVSGQLQDAKITGVRTPAVPLQQNLAEWMKITKGKVYASAAAGAGAAAAAAMDSAAAAAWDSAAALEELE